MSNNSDDHYQLQTKPIINSCVGNCKSSDCIGRSTFAHFHATPDIDIPIVYVCSCVFANIAER